MAYMESLKVVLTLLVLVYASRLDWISREIDDRSWVSLLALGGFFLLLEPWQFRALALSLLAASILVAATYIPGMMGGGDAKILLGIAAVFPISPLYHTPFFVLGVFSNAVLLAISLPIYYFLRNLMRERRIRREDFIKMFVGYKVRADKVKEFEAVMRDGLVLNVNKARLGERGDASAEVWVTPAVPFLIPLTIGFLFAVLVGDVFNYALFGGA